MAKWSFSRHLYGTDDSEVSCPNQHVSQSVRCLLPVIGSLCLFSVDWARGGRKSSIYRPHLHILSCSSASCSSMFSCLYFVADNYHVHLSSPWRTVSSFCGCNSDRSQRVDYHRHGFWSLLRLIVLCDQNFRPSGNLSPLWPWWCICWFSNRLASLNPMAFNGICHLPTICRSLQSFNHRSRFMLPLLGWASQ